ncbi:MULTISPECIES: AI-2E family transporter [Mumia]|uniref:AI-2E family transporter n=1 Tax=Mumia TaxID=1546255 RepID=UPI00141EB266|nr:MULTISPECIES: AI-2E family transporter [unclassified Mumia]QMW67466.1 AI-2E family transporter [Mumia sp. ZJ1417]
MPDDREPSTRLALPREPLIILTCAGALAAAIGLRVFAGIIAPLILALVLVVAVQPVRDFAVRRGVPEWLATGTTLLAVYAIVGGFGVALVVAAGRFATLLGEYEPQFQAFVNDIGDLLESWGVGSAEVQEMIRSIDLGSLVGIATDLIGGVAGAFSSIFFIVVLLFFVATDAGAFASKLRRVPSSGSRTAEAFGRFAQGTRTYLVVSTLFGLVVALVDVVALYALDIRDPWLWGILAFLTNYIPNIGFIIGLIPPTIIALLDHGWGTALAVILVYSAVNFVLQTLVQPRVVGNTVGLSGSLTFLSLIFWASLFGGIGAILAIPLTLFVKAVFVDVSPDRGWIGPLLSSDTVPKAVERTTP